MALVVDYAIMAFQNTFGTPIKIKFGPFIMFHIVYILSKSIAYPCLMFWSLIPFANLLFNFTTLIWVRNLEDSVYDYVTNV